jgi:hypothetical protein
VITLYIHEKHGVSSFFSAPPHAADEKITLGQGLEPVEQLDAREKEALEKFTKEAFAVESRLLVRLPRPTGSPRSPEHESPF